MRTEPQTMLTIRRRQAACFSNTPKHSMEEISETEASCCDPARRRPDLLTVLMAACTGLFVVGSLWMRFGPEPRPGPPKVGTLAPRIVLTDLEGREQFVFTGTTGKVIWITFRSGLSKDVLNGLERVWKLYGGHRNFVMIDAMTEADDLGGSIQRQRRARDAAYVSSHFQDLQ